MTAEASKAKAGRGDPFAHVTAAGWGRGAQRARAHHPDDACAIPGRPALAIGSTFVAATLQLDDPAPARPRGRPDPGRRWRPAAAPPQAALWTTALLLFGGQRAARPLHDGAELLRRVGRPPRRLRAAPRLLREAAAAELRLPRPGALGRSDHPRHARSRRRADVLLDRHRAAGAARRADRRRRLPADLAPIAVLGLLALSFVPFVAWRSSVTQLRAARHLAASCRSGCRC